MSGLSALVFFIISENNKTFNLLFQVYIVSNNFNILLSLDLNWFFIACPCHFLFTHYLLPHFSPDACPFHVVTAVPLNIENCLSILFTIICHFQLRTKSCLFLLIKVNTKYKNNSSPLRLCIQFGLNKKIKTILFLSVTTYFMVAQSHRQVNNQSYFFKLKKVVKPITARQFSRESINTKIMY